MRKEIPGITGYVADDRGNIYGPDGEIRTTYRNGDGYITTLVKTDNGVFRTVGVHQLVGLAFKLEERTPEKFQINHLDGDIENNVPDNVDWETPANNNLHASLLSEGRDRKIVTVDGNGTVSYFKNLWEVSSFTNSKIGDVWKAFRDNKEIAGLKIYVNINLGPEFHLTKIKTRDHLGRQIKRILKMQNLETKEIITGHASELGRIFGVSAAHITTTVTDETLRLFNEKWIIVDEKSEFPIVDNDTWLYLKERGKAKPVIAIDPNNRQVVLRFKSAAEFVRASGLSKKAVTVRLKVSRCGKVDGWAFSYEDCLDDIGLKEL
jgi:predicted XRE-type DNA-binding protein